MMTRAFRDAWIAKLRSGEIKQGREYLCKNDARCCLGVAYLVDDAGAEISNEDVGINTYTLFDDYSSLPTNKHEVHWGLNHGDVLKLAEMNDNGKSFNEIADYIEEHLPVED